MAAKYDTARCIYWELTNSMAPTYKGKFRPKNPQKYQGRADNIVFRSAWELTFLQYCDTNPNVLKYASEEVAINYYFVGTGKWHRYFPDMLLQIRTPQNTIETLVVEIKPYKQTIPPTHTSLTGRKKLREAVEYAKNQAKWQAASAWAKQRGWKFVVITEKELFPKS